MSWNPRAKALGNVNPSVTKLNWKGVCIAENTQNMYYILFKITQISYLPTFVFLHKMTPNLTGYFCQKVVAVKVSVSLQQTFKFYFTYRVCHGFKTDKWADYFQVTFDHFWSKFEAALAAVKIGLILKPNPQVSISPTFYVQL